MTMLIEMPVVAPASPRREVVQKRLSTIYHDRFADLKEQYRIPDEARVFAFLRQHSQLISVLEEGRAVVTVIFGEETPIMLHLQRDPEVGLEYVIAWIQTDLPVSEAVDRLMELNDVWFGERLAIVGELLSYNLGGRA